jgi:hypothetical protein
MTTSKLRRLLAATTLAGSMMFLGVACDDNAPEQVEKIDEDDTQPGPGDGSDEIGPGR